MQYIKEMQSRYHKALAAFHVYQTLRELSAPNIVGQKEAENNVELMGRFVNFFQPIRESTRVYFFLELAKMFDNSNQSLQINKILSFTVTKRKNMTVEDFAEHNKDRQLIEHLIKEYKQISEADIVELRQLLDLHKGTIKKLLKYRNKWLAHEDIKKPSLPSISGEEIIALFELVEKIMNTLGSILNSETWMWDHVKSGAKTDTEQVISYLRKYEPYRIKEIYEEADRELKEYYKPEMS